jgi:hypothetical protein
MFENFYNKLKPKQFLNLDVEDDFKMPAITKDFDKFIPPNEFSDNSLIYINTKGYELHILIELTEILTTYVPTLVISLEKYFCMKFSYDPQEIQSLLQSVYEYYTFIVESDYPYKLVFIHKSQLQKFENLFNLSFNVSKNTFDNTKRITGVEPEGTISFEKVFLYQLLCNWTSSENLINCWNKMMPKNCKVKVTAEEQPYKIIINSPPPNTSYIPEKTMVFRMEPDCDVNFKSWFSHHSEKNFLRFFDFKYYRNNTEWHLKEDYETLLNLKPQKTKTISSIMSGLYFMEGHKLRINFLKELEKEIEIDIYGKDNVHNFTNYRNALEYHNKSAGILPYKYTFIAENCDINNYFTEKINDAILGETLCFYWGCSNLENYLPRQSFIRLPLHNIKESINIVKTAIAENEWEKRLPAIREAKEKILKEYSFFNRIYGISLLNNAIIKPFSDDNLVEWNNKAVSCGISKKCIYHQFDIFVKTEILTNEINDVLIGVMLKVINENIYEFYDGKIKVCNI